MSNSLKIPEHKIKKRLKRLKGVKEECKRSIGLLAMIEHLSQQKVMAEIDSYAGISTKTFAESFEHIYAIDPWENGYDDEDMSSYQFSMPLVKEIFDHRMKDYANIAILKMSSCDAVLQFADASLDFVYIDALHTYEGVKKDIELWWPKIRVNGAIGGHDYDMEPWYGVRQAIDERFKQSDIMLFEGSNWLKKK